MLCCKQVSRPTKSAKSVEKTSCASSERRSRSKASNIGSIRSPKQMIQLRELALPTGNSPLRPFIAVHCVEMHNHSNPIPLGAEFDDGCNVIRLYFWNEIDHVNVSQALHRVDFRIRQAGFGRERHSSSLHEFDLRRRSCRHCIVQLAFWPEI